MVVGLEDRVVIVIQLLVLYVIIWDVVVVIVCVIGCLVLIDWGEDEILCRLFGVMLLFDVMFVIFFGFCVDVDLEVLVYVVFLGDL